MLLRSWSYTLLAVLSPLRSQTLSVAAYTLRMYKNYWNLADCCWKGSAKKGTNCLPPATATVSWSQCVVLWIIKRTRDVQLGMLLSHRCPFLLFPLWQRCFCLIRLFLIAAHCFVHCVVSSWAPGRMELEHFELCYFCQKGRTKVTYFPCGYKGKPHLSFGCNVATEALDSTPFLVTISLVLPPTLAIVMISSHGE